MQLVNQNTDSISGAFGVDPDTYEERFFEPCKSGFIRWQRDSEDERRPAEVIEDLRKEIQPVGDTEHFLFAFAMSSILEQAKALARDPLAEMMAKAFSN